MQQIIYLLTMLVLCTRLNANDREINVSARIKNVTVFLSGAELLREADVLIKSGRTTLKFKNLSSRINPSSVSASIRGNAKIISILHQHNFLISQKKNNQIHFLEDSLELLTYELEKIEMERTALLEEQKILTHNTTRLGKDEAVTTSELMSAVNFYRSKLNEINDKLLSLSMKEKKINPITERIKSQLLELNAVESKPVSEILVVVDSESGGKIAVQLKYLVNDAAWAPNYDIRTKGAGHPIELDYRAEILNNSYEDWTNVKITLSTADPTRNMERPSLQPWGLSYTRSRRGTVNPYTTSGNEGMLNNYQAKPDAGSKGGIERKVEVSYSDIEISELSVDFQIKESYSIPSDRQLYIVDINEYKLDASYNYFAIPKVDKDAFVLAKITGWESLNLIDGPANIYFNETYIGRTTLETKYSNDTLELSLGRDRKVIINRVKKQDYNSKKLIGMNQSESFTYEINIRNTNSDSIEIEIQDQVPITQESDIEISVDEISKAQHDIVSGKLVWKLQLAPAESKKLVVSFTVKYPKNKDIVIRKSRVVACPKFRTN